MGNNRKPFIVFQTDFKLTTGLVASMYGVVKTVDPSLEIFDLTHEIPEFDILAASGTLRSAMPYWPPGTIFVSVVDPGVGTARRACVAGTKNGYYIVTPDNGALTYIDKFFGIDEVREIDESINRLRGSEKSHTFHGRDLFAYTAARLASGIITYQQVGPAYPAGEVVLCDVSFGEAYDGGAHGELMSVVCNFGIFETNILCEDFEKTGISHGDMVRVTVKYKDSPLFDDDVLFHKSFGYAGVGEPILFCGSSGFMELGLNQASFSEKFLPKDIRSLEASDFGISIVKG